MATAIRGEEPVAWIPGAVVLIAVVVLIVRTFVRGMPDENVHKAGDGGARSTSSL
jgi:hypothetical protein